MSRTKTIAVGAICAVAATGTTATAASLITSAKIADGTIMNRDIHRGTISESRLDRGVVAKLNRLAVPGPAGARGATGASGATGATGAPGADGQVAGVASQNGLNAATTVNADGDAGWTLTGKPAAKLTGGVLRLAGSFDASTAAGGIGITHAYQQAPLSTLSALTYTARVDKRPNGTVNAPVIHVTLTGANTGTTSGFTNLVFEPYQNGGTELSRTYTFDVTQGKLWSTRALSAGTPDQVDQAHLATLAQIAESNPNAKVIAISVDNGGSSADTISADDFAAAADNLVVGFGASVDSYDFGG
jgi:hypothetical protein